LKSVKLGKTGSSKSKEKADRRQSTKDIRKSLTAGDLANVKGVETNVQQNYIRPLTEEEPYNINLEVGAASRLQTGTDWYGNPITDPDRSNPTRNRYESPLQTILSFEYAIQREESRSSMEIS
jgi:Uncharacterised protein (DUF2406)